MGFEDIFEEWENKYRRTGKASNEFEEMLDDYLPDNIAEKKEIITGDEKSRRIKKRRKLRNMNPEKVLDLHGCTVEEALARTEKFIHECRNRNIRKVLVIHGKGRHSQKGPVLGRSIRKWLQECPLTGETGIPPESLGGNGAVWVILK